MVIMFITLSNKIVKFMVHGIGVQALWLGQFGHIVKKLQYPDFVSFVCKYDILCLTETINDITDVINISGFVVHMPNRFDIAEVK